MISERQKDILWAVIEAHTKLAEPVSSKALAKERGFEIGAPMIRKEMNQLEKEGYLASPHTSAGRVPTDKAYRLYIQERINNKPVELTSKEKQKVNESLNQKLPEHVLLQMISKVVSELSKELSVAGTVDGRSKYFCGFSNLSDEPEFGVFENLNHQLMWFMDNLDTYFEQLWKQSFFEDLNVFIGHENPIKEINEFTLITGKYQLPEGTEGFVSIVGPKRMNYRRNMALVEYISGCINKKIENRK